MEIEGVETICGTDFKPTGILTVKLPWKYDKAKSHIQKLGHTLYFPDPPVNMIRSTSLDYQYYGDEVTHIKTKCHSY